jgi:hypothetical protein
VFTDEDYEPLLSINGRPVLLVKDTPKQKIVVLTFSLHYSNLPIRLDFPMLMHNIFSYFFPSMTDGSSFSVGESIKLESNCDEMVVSHKDGVVKEQVYSKFPATFKADIPGTYNLEQVTFSGKPRVESIYVKIPSSESNICKIEEALQTPYIEIEEEDYFKDLLLYFAAALVAFVFIEWWLHSRENM